MGSEYYYYLNLFRFSFIHRNVLPMYACAMYESLVPLKVSRRHLIPWELELQMVMNHHVGAGD